MEFSEVITCKGLIARDTSGHGPPNLVQTSKHGGLLKSAGKKIRRILNGFQRVAGQLLTLGLPLFWDTESHGMLRVC